MNPSHLLLCFVQLDKFLLNLLSLIIEIILLSLHFLALWPQIFLSLLELGFLHLILSVPTFYLVEHFINPRNFIAKSNILFDHVLLQISKLFCSSILLLLMQELLHLLRLCLIDSLQKLFFIVWCTTGHFKKTNSMGSIGSGRICERTCLIIVLLL